MNRWNQTFLKLVVLFGWVGIHWAAPRAEAVGIDDAADWLITQQEPAGTFAMNGAFPWTVGGTVASNTQGATARGLLDAWRVTGNPAHLNAAIRSGDFIISKYGGISGGTYGDGDHRFATHDPRFLEDLSVATGDPTYASYVQTNFWDKLSLATYGAGNDLDAAGFGAAVFNGRAGSGNVELAPWDLADPAIGAHLAGETTARNAFLSSILDGLEATTASDNSFDTIGLAGAIWASATTGVDLDPTAGRYASADSTADLAEELLQYIAPNGGWVFNSTADVNDPTNADAQVTAFSMLALDALDRGLYAAEINGGRNFLLSLQEPSGQILPFLGASSTSTGGVEVHGESLFALSVTTPEPSPIALWTVVAVVGLAVAWRRRHRNR